MKRTAATLALLAGFSGGCMSTDGKKEPVGGFGTVSTGKQLPGVIGPSGEPVMASRMVSARGAMPGAVTQAGGARADSSKLQQVALFHKAESECSTCAHVPGMSGHFSGHHSWGGGGGGGMPPQGQFPGAGIFPVPGQGPPGAVAAVGAIVPGMGGANGALANGRTSVKFTGPAGMKITWQLPNGEFNPEASGLVAPAPYNFVQGQVYRLRLTQVLPNHPGKSFYPTLEVSPGNPKTLTFLAHASVPLTFTNEDFDQAVAGNLVVKVIYLPDRDNQDFATVAGAEELVSTRLEPGADPVAEAQRRGSILLIVRLGNIDLENRASPAMTAPPPGMPMPGMIPPGMMPRPVGPGGPGFGPGGPIGPGGPPMGGMPPGLSTIPGPTAPPKTTGTPGIPTTLPSFK